MIEQIIWTMHITKIEVFGKIINKLNLYPNHIIMSHGFVYRDFV